MEMRCSSEWPKEWGQEARAHTLPILELDTAVTKRFSFAHLPTVQP